MTPNRAVTPNRVVAVLTPLLFAPLAGAVAAWLAEHFPGVEIDSGSLEQVFIAGALIALAPAAQWLHGWQKYEARQATVEREIAIANAVVPPPAFDSSGIDESVDLGEPEELFDEDDEPVDEFDDLEALDEDLDSLELDDLDDEDLLEEDFLDEEEPATAGS